MEQMQISEKHQEWIRSIKSIIQKKGKIQSKNSDMNNFLRLCIYRNRKGSLPDYLKVAFDEAGIELD